MNIMRNKAKTIADRGGLRAHMAELGKNYDAFISDVNSMNQEDGRLNISRLARRYNITRNTVYKWLAQDQQER